MEKPVPPKPEVFALVLEQREIIELLSPYWGCGYTIGLGEPHNNRFRCEISRRYVDSDGSDDEWEVIEGGDTLLEAVQNAVSAAQRKEAIARIKCQMGDLRHQAAKLGVSEDEFAKFARPQSKDNSDYDAFNSLRDAMKNP